jgi:hypothetical protein
MTDLATVISARNVVHEAACCRRHLPLWGAFAKDGPVVFASPEDAPIPGSMRVGRSGHVGAESIWRMLCLWHVAATLPARRVLFQEYDSFCLDTDLSAFAEPGLWCNRFTDLTRQYTAAWFGHNPMLIDRESLLKLLRVSHGMDLNAEKSVGDRWLSVAVERAGVAVHAYGPRGYSRNEIKPDDLPAAVEAVTNGATMIHGVKSPEVFAALTAAYQTRRST